MKRQLSNKEERLEEVRILHERRRKVNQKRLNDAIAGKKSRGSATQKQRIEWAKKIIDLDGKYGIVMLKL